MIVSCALVEGFEGIDDILPLAPFGEGQSLEYLTAIDATPDHRVDDIRSRSDIAEEGFLTSQTLFLWN